MPTAAITNSNLAEFAKPGLASAARPRRSAARETAWCDDACLDKYFTVTGAAATS